MYHKSLKTGFSYENIKNQKSDNTIIVFRAKWIYGLWGFIFIVFIYIKSRGPMERLLLNTRCVLPPILLVMFLILDLL